MAKLVCINGSPRRVSRTGVLVDAVAAAVATHVAVERRDIRMAADGPDILSGLTRETLSPRGEALCAMVEDAAMLVVASPVYRASYTGLLKHLFDLVDRDAMRGCAAVLVASGGTPMHGLVMEHQFRPLMAFFGIACATTTIYALGDDIVGDRVADPQIAARIARAAEEVVALPAPTRLPGAIARAAA